jgi:hypothetical protein
MQQLNIFLFIFRSMLHRHGRGNKASLAACKRERWGCVDVMHSLQSAVLKEADTYDDGLFYHADGSADLDRQNLQR